MHEDDIIFSANQGVNSLEGKNLQSRRLNYGGIEYSEELVV